MKGSPLRRLDILLEGGAGATRWKRLVAVRYAVRYFKFQFLLKASGLAIMWATVRDLDVHKGIVSCQHDDVNP